MIDLCTSTSISIVPASIEKLVAFAGFTVSSKVKYTFNDTVSKAKTQTTDSNDFCGEKQLSFTLKGTITSYLNGSNSDFIYLSPLSNITNFGSAIATVKASMKNNPTIVSSPISFTVTILGSQAPNISDYLYTLDSTKLTMQYDSFLVFPLDYDVGITSIKAYIYTGTE